MTPRAAYDAGLVSSEAEPLLGTDQEHEAIIPVYHLVLPEGMDAPLPHLPAREAKAANLD